MKIPIITALSKNYARALYQSLEDEAARDAVEAELLLLGDILRRAPDFLATLANVALPLSLRMDICLEISGIKASSPTVSFIKLLLSRKRLKELAHIIEAWSDLRRSVSGTLLIWVELPRPISGTEQSKLQKRLTSIMQKQVTLSITINPRLLGGVIFYYNGRVLDCSVQGHLRAAKEHLLAPEAVSA